MLIQYSGIPLTRWDPSLGAAPISAAVIGKASMWEMLKTEVVCEPTFTAESFLTGRGRRERPSASSWLLLF